ncbi:unnamed protein product [Sphenostylis stenocarpa]|uniref:Protein kinase domain-containing protein n=1 Tax=Sphenostylis stenocarpa TaxID=92480 RepID=A0AA86W2Z0_9FABA|nr:unnamed protein product [Sphenostylis stenocarpa]
MQTVHHLSTVDLLASFSFFSQPHCGVLALRGCQEHDPSAPNTVQLTTTTSTWYTVHWVEPRTIIIQVAHLFNTMFHDSAGNTRIAYNPSLSIFISKGKFYCAKGGRSWVVKNLNMILAVGPGSKGALVYEFMSKGFEENAQLTESMVSIFGARGTAGYIAPEVFSRNFGVVSHKSDVYSYGMMILEMIGGRKNFKDEVDPSSENILS